MCPILQSTTTAGENSHFLAIAAGSIAAVHESAYGP
jgi:hypothetical protein